MDSEEMAVMPDETNPAMDESVELEDQETSQAPDEGQASEQFDPDSYVDNLELPDEHKKVLKESLLRQADYTRKTQELAQQRELVSKWTPVIDKLVSDEQLFNQVMGLTPQETAQEQELPQDPREYAEYVKQQTIAEMRQTMATERDLETAATLDPRLTSQEPSDLNMQRVLAGVVAQDQALLAGQKSYTQAVADALAWYDNEFYKGIEKGVQNSMNQRVTQKRFVSPKSSSPISTKAESKATTILDSWRETERELGLA